MTKLCVDNLPFSDNEKSLHALFVEFGMSSDDAAKAIQGLNGEKNFGGRPLEVKEAQDPNRPGPNHSQR
jgi:hypothetical protein